MNYGTLSPQSSGQLRARVSPAMLGQLASQAAQSRDRWSAAVRFDAGRRWYGRLEQAADYEIWLLSWLPGQETGFHDHGEANGAFAVAKGELRERTGTPGRPELGSRVLGAGQCRSFGRRYVHDVSNTGSVPAVSVHAYSPPLTVMHRYALTGGVLAHSGTQQADQDW